MAFKLNQADIEFVLQQIKIAEANANGIPLTAILLDASGQVIANPDAMNGAVRYYTAIPLAGGGFTYAAADPLQPRAIPDAQTPFGLRTVDGTYNNLVEGRETWGASGQPMPRQFDAGGYLNDDDVDPVSFGGGISFSNSNYAPGTDSGTPFIADGSVTDADPRLISNLIVDMSLNNPAAIVAALTFAGSENIHGATGDLQALQALDWQPFIDILTDPTSSRTARLDAMSEVNDLIEPFGLEVDETGSLVIPNIAPDEGLSAPFNAWMTFFGQFFDHGLDLISKGGAGTIYVPLQPDDPLYVEGSATNFMVLTRSTPVTDANGVSTQQNNTTPFVDQNQTYTSHASHQVFLREYKLDGGRPVATGKLLDGNHTVMTVDGPQTIKNGLPTWADVKAQALMLGIELTDRDATSVPLLRTDAYGNFIPNANGYAQLITNIGADGIPNTADDTVVSGTPTAPVNSWTVGAVRTDNAFLDDIAHNAAPNGTFDHDNNPGTPNVAIAADTDSATGNSIATDMRGNRVAYDNELLDRHFITGDGRGNENIGLTAVHHIFHSEHNRQVEDQKLTILRSGDLAFINEWLTTDVAALDPGFAGMTALQQTAYAATLNWDGERLFQAGRFATEMQYQHLVFEEFARKIQPAIDPFVFNAVTDINPAIFAEFANVVYRFGHSMLTDSMPRILLNTDGTVSSTDDVGLIASFLNPVMFDNNGAITDEQAAGAVVRGMTVERGNEIDEFVTGALRNNLLGIPLDLAAINIARGRDTNMPTLNEARTQLFAATSSSFLTPYESWVDFAANLKNPMSVVNFIAAYGTHDTILAAGSNIEAARAAAMLIVFGGAGAPTDRFDFLNGTGAWSSTETGLNLIDLWIGGLAEKKMPFGGFLGSTFNAVFEAQLEALQDGDRFYYLTRTQGQNLLVSLEQNSFAKMIMANTDIAQPGPDGIRGTPDDIIARHIGVDAFAVYDSVLEVNKANQAGEDPTGNDAVLEALGLGKVQRDNLATAGINEALPDTTTDQSGPTGHYIRVTGGEHVLVGGTNGDDTIITDFGDDGIWGDAGNDRIESGAGVDLVNGGAGDDIITDSGDTGDFLKGDEGNDVIANSNGLDILMGGDGKDVFFVGVDDTEVFAGQGDDFILGGDGVDLLMGNEGDDWIEAGGGFDTTAGDNSELFFNSKILGHDVMFAGSEEHDFDGESGDDIMVQGESVMRNEGMLGFDWAIHKGSDIAADSDLTKPIFTTDAADILRDRFDAVEALSGWDKNDVLRGDDRGDTPLDGAGGEGLAGAEGTMVGHELTQAGINRIEGLRALLGSLVDAAPTTPGVDLESIEAFNAGNVLLGGAGSDLIEGRGGNDFIDGDAWLNVRIRITAAGADNTANAQLATIDSLKHTFTASQIEALGLDAGLAGKTLSELMIGRHIVPTQLNIVREVVVDDGAGDLDVAVFNDSYVDEDGNANYIITPNADGTVTVEHVNVTIGIDPQTGRQIVSDGVDTLRNIEILRFTDQDIVFNPPELFLQRDAVNYEDSFTAATFGNSTGDDAWVPDWAESGDLTTGNVITGGQIQLDAGNNGGSNALRFIGGAGSDGATITRNVDLSGTSAATLSYSANPDSMEAGENVLVQFAADGVNFVTLRTITGNGGNQNFNEALTGPFTAAAAIRFLATAMNETNDVVTIDNLAVNFTRNSVNYTTTFTEGNGAATGANVDIASNPLIVEDGEIVSARIVLTNPQAGDSFVIPGNLPGNINSAVATIAGQIVVTLTGNEPDIADWQAALQAIEFVNSSQNPSTTPRIIQVTVNNGFQTSEVATTTVNVQAVDDPVNAGNDSVITNIVPGTAIIIPKWVLLANDVDLDNTLDIAAVSGLTSLTAVLGASSITVTDTGVADGDFDYTATGGPDTDNAFVDVDTVATTTTLSEAFGSTSYTDSDGAWTQDWIETGDDGSSTSDNGQIRIATNRLEFDGASVGTGDGAVIQRLLTPPAGALSATISYDFGENLDGGESVTVEFWDGTSFRPVQTITSASNNGSTELVLTGPFTAGAFIRFTASAMNNDADVAFIDNLDIAFYTPVTAVNGTAASEILIGDGAGSTFDAGTGNDIILAGAGVDTIVWNANANGATDGRDFVDGGEGSDTFDVNTRPGTNESFRVYTVDAALNGPDAIVGLTAAGLRPGTEIIITRTTGGAAVDAASIIAELDNIEEIRIGSQIADPTAGSAGAGDTVAIFGNFSSTSLALSTITINGGAGDDTVDITSLLSAHRIVFRSNGGNDTIVGTLRPQDVIELVEGGSLADYVATVNPNGTTTLSNGTHSITYSTSGDPVIDEETAPPRGAFEITPRDLEGIQKLVRGELPFDDDDDATGALGPRSISGEGNNEDNPGSGQADTHFIRLTEARYGEMNEAIGNRDLNPIYDGLDPRAISNILGAQEEGLPNAVNKANIFFMAFGQYVDHGLDFLPKSAVNGTVQIGAPGTGAPGQGNPADLTRGEVDAIEGGVPQHINTTTAYVDQNQAYGSHNLVTQFLREGDGAGGLTSHLLKGAPDPSNPSFSLLPTLREAIQHHWDNNTIFTDPSLPGGQIAFRTYYSNYPVSDGVTGDLTDGLGGFDPQVYAKLAGNFMGTGQALLLDSNPFISLLDHYVAGDGRTNENFALTSIHTIWSRNHNFHADQLEAAGFQGTQQELFDAAKIINEAEYQRVVFDEYADALLGGLRAMNGSGGSHGHDGYNEDADAGISHEFAAAAFRFGHSLIGQTLTVMDENGQPMQVSLVDAFLNPTNDAGAFPNPLPPGYVPQPGYAQYGVGAIVDGVARQPAEAVDFNIVDAVRNDLVRIQADLFAFNLARGRDVGLGTLNQIRNDLAASNNSYVEEAVGFAGDMSAYTSWEDFQQRNGLSDAVIAQFRQAYPDLVLDTPAKLAAFVAANPDIALVNGNTVKGIDRVDFWLGGLAEKHINDGMVGQTFWVVLHEQFDRLQEADRFYYKDRLEAFDFYEAFIDGQEFSDIVARNTGLTDLDEHIFEVNDEDNSGEDEDDDDTVGNGNGDDDDDEDGDTSGNGDDDDDEGDDTTGSGDDDDDEDDDTSGDDDEDDDASGTGDDDDDDEETGLPVPSGGSTRVGTGSGETLLGTAAGDHLIGLGGDDVLVGDGGDDAIVAGEGADFVDGGAGRDTIQAGAGDDTVFAGADADLIEGEAGADRIFAQGGNDIVHAGAGNDMVVGGSGDDLFVGEAGDGNDTYFGDEIDGGNGIDTLDLSAITANLTVDLGNGLLGRGRAVSSESGSDTLWHVENVATGSGDDRITASAAVNVMEGGAGDDTFRFLDAAGADGDTILDFEPGDRLDLSGIDADGAVTGNQSFTLVAGPNFTASGQLMVTYETREGVEYTVVQGNVGGGNEAEFRIDLKGSHNLTGASFTL